MTFANAAKADTTFKMPAKAVEVTANWKYTGSDSDNDKDDDYTLKYVTNGGKVISSETKSRSWVKDYEDLPTPPAAATVSRAGITIPVSPTR